MFLLIISETTSMMSHQHTCLTINLTKDNSNNYANVNYANVNGWGRSMRPQPYTHNNKQSRQAGSGRDDHLQN